MLDAAISLLFLAASGALPITTSGPGVGGVTVDAPWIAWADDGRPRVAQRTGPGSAPGRTAIVVRELDSGRTFTAEIDRRAIVMADRVDARALGLRVIRPLLDHRLWLVESLTGEDGLTIAHRVPGAVPDLWLRLRALGGGQTEFDDPLLTSQWYVRKLELPAAWALEAGDPAINVAITDNGCDLTHPELAAKLDPGLDVIDTDDDPSFAPMARGNEHGTACAGLIGAIGNNATGIVGACPGCRLRCVRMLSPDDGLVQLSMNVDAFRFQLDNGVAVSSNSWGFVQAIAVPGPLRTVITALVEEGRGGLGSVVVFAAGNDNRELDADELTGVDGVVTVAAVNNFEEPTSFTNFGDTVDLAAFTGTFTLDIIGADGHQDGDYTQAFGGTSSAAPLVSGLFGLILSAAPDLTAAAALEIVRGALKPAPFAVPGPDGHDPKHGYGLIDPPAAVRAAIATRPPPPDAGVSLDAEALADAGVSADAAADASVTAPPPESDEGCGCTTAPAGSAPTIAATLLLVVVRRRRRA